VIYAVTGAARSGTSMMMEMLEAGGLDPWYSPRRDERLGKVPSVAYGYVPNPGSYYETDPADLEYRAQCLAGRCVKAIGPRPDLALPQVGGSRYRVIVMLRDPRASEISMRRAFQHGRILAPEQYWPTMSEAFSRFATRGDVDDVVGFWYPSVVEAPMFHVKLLQRHGWPIDAPDAAAAVPDEAWFRHRMPWE
jgi:hypothetical protein